MYYGGKEDEHKRWQETGHCWVHGHSSWSTSWGTQRLCKVDFCKKSNHRVGRWKNAIFHGLRARPVTPHPHLHMHFYIRNADADAGKCPTQPGKSEIWMKFFGGGAELLAFLRFMQGACYVLTTNNFSDVFEIIGAAFSENFTCRVHRRDSPRVSPSAEISLAWCQNETYRHWNLVQMSKLEMV